MTWSPGVHSRSGFTKIISPSLDRGAIASSCPFTATGPVPDTSVVSTIASAWMTPGRSSRIVIPPPHSR